MPSLRWPGAKAHDYLAAVRIGKSDVSLYLLVANTYPDALAGTPERLTPNTAPISRVTRITRVMAVCRNSRS